MEGAQNISHKWPKLHKMAQEDNSTIAAHLQLKMLSEG